MRHISETIAGCGTGPDRPILPTLGALHLQIQAACLLGSLQIAVKPVASSTHRRPMPTSVRFSKHLRLR